MARNLQRSKEGNVKTLEERWLATFNASATPRMQLSKGEIETFRSVFAAGAVSALQATTDIAEDAGDDEDLGCEMMDALWNEAQSMLNEPTKD